MRRQLARFAFRLARLPASRRLVGWVFAHMIDFLPVQRLRETDTLLAFHHPRPSHAVHILLVPRRAIASLNELQSEDQAFLSDLFQTVQSLVTEFNLEKRGYRLIVNGGKYQEVPQLHFHLIADEVDVDTQQA